MKAIAPLFLRQCRWCFALLASFGVSCDGALAEPSPQRITQIVPDETLGTEASQVESSTPSELLIRGGARRQENLFHSFQRFSIDEGQRAYFDNPTGIARIFSRVTGESPSDIFGTLGVNGSADLFLLNPNGILFGPNAQLDIAGSFAASTADSVVFADGNEFSATALETSLLTISTPLGIQFNNVPQGNLSSLGQLNTAGDLSFYGRSLTIEGSVIAGGDITLIGDREILAGARFKSGGDIQFLTPTHSPGNLTSADGSTISANGDVTLGDYIGGALKIESVGSIAVGNIVITRPNTTSATDSSDSDEYLLASRRTAILRAGSDLEDNTNRSTNRLPSSITLSSINTSDWTGGKGGPIILEAEGDITATGAFESPFGFPTALGAASFSVSGRSSDTGAISIFSSSGEVSITGDIDSTSVSLSDSGPSESGSGGDITIFADGSIDITGGFFATSYSFSGSDTSESNSGGNVIISSNNNIDIVGNLFSPSLSIVRESGRGRAVDVSETGDVDLAGGLISFSDSSSFSSISRGNSASEENTSQSGKGGTVAVSASEEVAIVGFLSSASSSFSDSGSSGSENGGAVTISADGDVEIAGELSSSSSSLSALGAGKSGDGGTTSIASNNGNIRFIEETGEGESEARILRSIVSSSFASAEAGSGGNVSLRAPAGAIISRSTQIIPIAISGDTGTTGAGGDFSLAAADSISGLEILTLSSGGESGDVEIKGLGDNLNIRDFRITTTGQVQIPNPLSIGDSLTLNLDSLGQSGSTHIISQRDLTFDNVIIQADANGAQTAGGVSLTSLGQITLSNSAISSNANSSGDAGEIRIDAGRLILGDSANLSASTSGSGLAGDITLNVTDTLKISDSTVTSSTRENSTGLGGNIRVTASTTALRNGSSIEVNSQGTGQSGTATILGDQLILADRSRINATTLSSNGGNLKFNLEDLLLLRGNSEISTTAGIAGAGGDGGDVAVNTRFVVATPNENNDIAANAFDGNGGNVSIATASGIFGITPRLFNTPSSDITASSENGVSGNITVQSPDVNLGQALTELPTAFAVPDVARSCREALSQGNEFIVSGRGGLPQSPLDSAMIAIWQDMLPIESDESVSQQASSEPTPVTDSREVMTPSPIVEVQGWIKDENGQVVLVAEDPRQVALGHPAGC